LKLLINIASEDELSEAVGIRLVNETFGLGRLGHLLGRRGNGYLVKKLPSLRQMALREPVLILTDLDDTNCAPTLLQRWSGGGVFPENLLFRVAVRETEAWLLADREGMGNLLGVSPNKIPADPETIPDPKRFLLNLARSAKREVRSELTVARGVVASQGLGYNQVLSAFASENWQLGEAANRSVSLAKALVRLQELAHRMLD